MLSHHRLLASPPNCKAVLNHVLGMFQTSVTIQRRNDDAVRRSVSPHRLIADATSGESWAAIEVRRSVSPHRLIASAHHRKTVKLNVPILKHALG